MKVLTLAGAVLLSLALTGGVMADEATNKASTQAGPVVVGNKICPVSGDKIGGEMGEAVSIEHEGKTYNLCCKMCIKDFQKDPQKYIEKINEEMKAQAAEKK